MPVPADVANRAPAPWSLSAMIDDIATFVRDPGDEEVRAQCLRSINSGIDDLNKRHWYWSLTYMDITAVAGTADYSLADDYDGFRSLQLFNMNGKPAGQLRYLDPQSFWDAYNVSTQAGDPCDCTVDSPETSRVLTLNCVPTASWAALYPTMRLRYFALVQHLVEPADTLAGVPNSAGLYVRWYAREDAALIYDPSLAGLAGARKDRLWQDLVKKDTGYHYLS